ncbi:MAG: YCF48-related protein [Candidatus Kapaibacterium sp.]
MNRRLGIALALILLIGTAANAQTASWKSVSPPGFDYLTGGIDFPSRDTGFAVSFPSTQGTDSYILQSTDKGETWAKRQIEGVTLYDVRFTSPSTGFAVGENTNCGCGVIYSTTNGGATWTPQTYSSTGLLYSIFFTSASKGFITGSNATLLKTTDGGKTWNPGSPNVGPDMDPRKIFFATPMVGYMMVALQSRDWTNVLMKTTDGGETWHLILDNGDNTDSKPTYSSMFFTSATVGYATGREGNSKTIYKTTDGGFHWTKKFAAAGPSIFLSMGGIQFLNDSLGYASGDEGTIVRTTDRGETWKREPSGTSTALPAMKFLDENTGFVGGLFGALIKRSIPLVPTAKFSVGELDFGTVESGSKDLSFTISAENELGVTVEAIRIQDPPGVTGAFSIVAPTSASNIKVPPGSPLTVTVRFTPKPGGAADQHSTLMIQTDDPARSAVSLLLLAQQGTAPSPSALLSASTLDFGGVPATGSKEMTFTLSAANRAGLRIDSIYIEPKGSNGDHFTVISPTEPFPMAVAQGTPLTFRIAYTPTSAGTSSAADLVVKTNDASKPMLTVALKGEGITPPASVDDRDATSAPLSLRTLPNPLAGTGQIILNIPTPGHVSVALYDLLGRRIGLLLDGTSEAGARIIPLCIDDLQEGVYYCIVYAGGRSAVQEITISR